MQSDPAWTGPGFPVPLISGSLYLRALEIQYYRMFSAKMYDKLFAL
jgi:hypothetical protein